MAALPRTSGDQIRHVLLQPREELCAPEQRDNTHTHTHRERERENREMRRRMWMEKKMKIKGLFVYVHDHRRGMDPSGTT
jgi:hypothetical protein